MIRNIGYACLNMTLTEGLPASKKVFTSRTLRQASFSIPKVSQLILANCSDLLTILKWNKQHNIRLFRISSEIFPFMDHPDLKYQISDLPDANEIEFLLSQCGKYAMENGMRLTSHPGPYNCLGSPNDYTVEKTILGLNMHALLGEMLGLSDFIINIHVGGSYGGDFENTAMRFVCNYNKLGESARKWLTVENDDKESMWTVTKLHSLIHSRLGIPIIPDLHHWLFCHEETMAEAVGLAMTTWAGKVPKIHYSESAPGKRPQAHSDYISGPVPDLYDGEYDVMFECKAKDKAVIQYIGKEVRA